MNNNHKFSMDFRERIHNGIDDLKLKVVNTNPFELKYKIDELNKEFDDLHSDTFIISQNLNEQWIDEYDWKIHPATDYVNGMIEKYLIKDNFLKIELLEEYRAIDVIIDLREFINKINNGLEKREDIFLEEIDYYIDYEKSEIKNLTSTFAALGNDYSLKEKTSTRSKFYRDIISNDLDYFMEYIYRYMFNRFCVDYLIEEFDKSINSDSFEKTKSELESKGIFSNEIVEKINSHENKIMIWACYFYFLDKTKVLTMPLGKGKIIEFASFFNLSKTFYQRYINISNVLIGDYRKEQMKKFKKEKNPISEKNLKFVLEIFKITGNKDLIVETLNCLTVFYE